MPYWDHKNAAPVSGIFAALALDPCHHLRPEADDSLGALYVYKKAQSKSEVRP